MKTASKIFWLYGRSGAGKTTLARRLRDSLKDCQISVFYLDGDELRSGLCSDLKFTSGARQENHRRTAEVAKLAAEQGHTVVVATMAPQHEQRDLVAKVLGQRLVWIYIHAPIAICIQRDPKGLYRKAQAGNLQNLIKFPFDVPRPGERKNHIDTAAKNVEECHDSILKIARKHLRKT